MTSNEEIVRGVRGRRGLASGKRRSLIDAVNDDELILFILNVGDGDAQVLCLPRNKAGKRPLIVVDVKRYAKSRKLVDGLLAAGFLGSDLEIPLLVATHHHGDHIGGMRLFVEKLSSSIREFWEPGSMPPKAQYINLINEVGEQNLHHTQPTAGLTRFFGEVRLQVLAPSARLRQAFDLYGVDENNASIVLRLDYPVARVAVEAGGTRRLLPAGHQSLVLGADAQAHSWSHVLADFPPLRASDSPVGAALKEAGFANPLKATVVKLSHHGSKHGTFYELVDRMKPKIACVSHSASSKHGFPHELALEAVREVAAPTAKTPGKEREQSDHDLGLHSTAECGTLAVVIPRTQKTKARVWTFGEAPSADVPLEAGGWCCA